MKRFLVLFGAVFTAVSLFFSFLLISHEDTKGFPELLKGKDKSSRNLDIQTVEYFSENVYNTETDLLIDNDLTDLVNDQIVSLSVEPVLDESGNVTCTELGYDYGYKIDPPENGTYLLDTIYSLQISNMDGIYFDWSSVLGMDAVIVKGGTDSNIYFYDPEEYGDTGLHAPINSASSMPYGLSHMEFCYDYELNVSKTAQTSLTREWNWIIEKQVSPSELYLFEWETGNVEYEIDVTKDGYSDSDWSVEGEISIFNPDPENSFIISKVEDSIKGLGLTEVECVGITFPYVLDSAEELVCVYKNDSLPNGIWRTNVATVYGEDDEVIGSDSVDFNFTDENVDIKYVYESVTVRDSANTRGVDEESKTWIFDDTGYVEYDVDLNCDDIEYEDGRGSYERNNTATIVQTGDSDSAEVDVNCYKLLVEKNAETSLTRTYEWNISKKAIPENINLFYGESETVDYEVEVMKTGHTDSEFTVSGEISLSNPNPVKSLVVEDVVDMVNDSLNAEVVCGTKTLPASQDMICTYEYGELEDSSAGTNFVTVYGESERVLGTASADFDFTSPVVNEINKEITVSDDNTSEDPWYFSEDGSANYSKEFNCSGLEYEEGYATYIKENTAIIEETKQEADANVVVDCYKPLVDKTALPSYTKTYDWDIQKSVSPNSWLLFDGESGTSRYDVSVTKGQGTDDDFSVSGEIYVYNPNPERVFEIYEVKDSISNLDYSVDVQCDDMTVGALGSLECTYESDLPDSDYRMNTVEVYSSSDWLMGSASAEIDFENVEPELLYDSVTVNDTNGLSWEFTDSGEVYYEKTFDCSDIAWTELYGENSYNNTAEIYELGYSDDALVSVSCYRLGVEKSADTYYERDYDWLIEKNGSLNEIQLELGQTGTVDYTIEVNPSGYTDKNFNVQGEVVIENPSPKTAIVHIDDFMNGYEVSLDCGDGYDLSLPIELDSGVLTCTYSRDLNEGMSSVNNVSLDQSLSRYDYLRQSEPNGMKTYTASADVVFDMPNLKYDECVYVNDDKWGSLGTVCAEDELKLFEYSLPIGPYQECGMYEFVNTASYTASDTSETGFDNWSISVDVACLDMGCTYTLGYWKTHADPEKKQYDNTWDELDYGPDTIFFNSGMTYLEVLKQPTKRNPYFILARQYIAAELNVLSGAYLPDDVEYEWIDAKELFDKYTPDEVLGDKELRSNLVEISEILDSYNNGNIGPGHCSD